MTRRTRDRMAIAPEQHSTASRSFGGSCVPNLERLARRASKKMWSMNTTRYVSRSKAHRRSGATLVIFAIMLPSLLAVVGLVIDAGMLMAVRRQAQTAADAAALAATHDL